LLLEAAILRYLQALALVVLSSGTLESRKWRRSLRE